ncbi:26637_t:CDS:1, partial [Racocetra persica]
RRENPQKYVVNVKKKFYKLIMLRSLLHDQNLIEPEEMKKNLFKSILEVGNNEFIENENSGIEFSCKVSTISLKSEPHELEKAIAKIVGSLMDTITC